MLKLFVLLFASFSTLAVPAFACSCMCTFEHTVSDYVEENAVFWGIPVESSLTEVGSVETKIRILEAYGHLAEGDFVHATSAPQDGASCGHQLAVGVPQLVTARKYDQNGLSLSNCSCKPPSRYLLQYLKEGQDTYLPPLSKCWPDLQDGIKTTSKCKVWRDAGDDWEHEAEELERFNWFRSE